MAYIGEIRIFAGNFAPANWKFCNGEILQITQYPALFNLIGTTYGGDGQETFWLPDLQGRLPVHEGNGYNLGEAAGVEEVTLTVQQIPAHSHSLGASLNAAGASSASGNVVGQVGTTQIYRTDPPSSALATSAVGSTGGSQPHTNMQPYLCVNFIISLFGDPPTQ